MSPRRSPSVKHEAENKGRGERPPRLIPHLPRPPHWARRANAHHKCAPTPFRHLCVGPAHHCMAAPCTNAFFSFPFCFVQSGIKRPTGTREGLGTGRKRRQRKQAQVGDPSTPHIHTHEFNIRHQQLAERCRQTAAESQERAEEEREKKRWKRGRSDAAEEVRTSAVGSGAQQRHTVKSSEAQIKARTSRRTSDCPQITCSMGSGASAPVRHSSSWRMAREGGGEAGGTQEQAGREREVKRQGDISHFMHVRPVSKT